MRKLIVKARVFSETQKEVLAGRLWTMDVALGMLAWLLGTVFGALALASTERGERPEKVGIYSRLMLGFYLLAFLPIVVADVISGVLWSLGFG